MLFVYILNTLFLLFFSSETSYWISGTYLVGFQSRKTSFVISFQSSDQCWPFLCLFRGFYTRNTYTVSCLFLERLKKHSCYVYVTTLRTEHIIGTLFVVCLSLKMFCRPFSGILTWKCINHTYLLADYTLNTPSSPYFFF